MSKAPMILADARHVRPPVPPVQRVTVDELHFHRARNDIARPVLAGVQIGRGTHAATLGLAYVNNTRAQVLLTVAHVCVQIGDDIDQPIAGDTIARVIDFAPDYWGAEVDVCKAIIPPTVEIDGDEVYGDLCDYTIDAFADWTAQGQAIQIEGAATGTSSGQVYLPNTQIQLQQGGRPLAAGLATYASQPMDSGAPVIGFDGEVATFYGLHGGRVRINSVEYSWFVPLGAFRGFMAR